MIARPQTLARHLERPLGVARLGVVVCAALAAFLVLVELPGTLDRLGDQAAKNSSLNYDDREFAAGNAIVVDKAALYQARALIPRDGTYRVVTGPHLKDATDLTLPFVASYARYFLMPRRLAESASWIICYGCETTQWGDRFEVVWQDDQGIYVGRLRG